MNSCRLKIKFLTGRNRESRFVSARDLGSAVAEVVKTFVASNGPSGTLDEFRSLKIGQQRSTRGLSNVKLWIGSISRSGANRMALTLGFQLACHPLSGGSKFSGQVAIDRSGRGYESQCFSWFRTRSLPLQEFLPQRLLKIVKCPLWEGCLS